MLKIKKYYFNIYIYLKKKTLEKKRASNAHSRALNNKAVFFLEKGQPMDLTQTQSTLLLLSSSG
jgi:hypothetical protein